MPAPIFIDGVMSRTATVGTSDFELGSAVPGFEGFESIPPGSTFYYFAKHGGFAAEVEVGIGTWMGNGVIVRAPINGPKTNFTEGTKTVRLIDVPEG